MEQKYIFKENGDLRAEGFGWFHPPKNYSESDHGLQMYMDAKHDYWRQTYYKPMLIKDSGHLLFKTFPVDKDIMVETKFSLNACNEFDQAGIMVRFDADHWIKAGIEYVDKKHKLSSVVTNVYSDWSAQDFPDGELTLRVYKFGRDFIVEAKRDGLWNFIRICHMNVDSSLSNVKIGLYACSPTDKGGDVSFEYVEYKKVDTYHHSAKS